MRHSPDGDSSWVWQDQLGRAVLAREASQKAGERFSYTRFDGSPSGGS